MPPRNIEVLFILIRGLGRESEHWGDFPKKLQAKISNSLVKCIDLPGTGENLAMTSPIHMRELSEFVRHETEFFKEKNKIEKIPTFILAPSLGGMVAADWMLSYPKDLEGAILINTSFSSWSKIWERLQPQAIRHILHIVLKEKDFFARESEVVKMVSNDKEKFTMHAKAWSHVFSARPIQLTTIMRQLIAAHSFKPPKVKIETPTLLLASSKDRMVNPVCSELIQKVWQCSIEIHPWAGHDIPLDDADWVVDKTLMWYESLVGKSKRSAPAQRTANH